MDNPKEPPPAEARRTLKLKAPANKAKVAPPRTQGPITPPPRPAAGSQQGRDSGTWADVYKKKMQADMDALGFGEDLDPRNSTRR